MWPFVEIFSDYTASVVASGAALLGLTAGACGAVVFIRKQTLLADTVSHACLPGVVLGFMFAGAQSASALFAGALITAFAAVGFVRAAASVSRVKFDSALAMGISISFGIGIVLLTAAQTGGKSGQAGLDRFLFGQASAMSADDVKVIAAAGAVCLTALAIFWKQVKALCFDPEYAKSAGFRTRLTGFFLNAILACAVVAGIETVGVVLMCSMLVAPAVAARHLTDKMGMMVVISAAVGAAGGAAGAVASWKISALPTGPAIVAILTSLAILSLLFSPKNGAALKLLKRVRARSDRVRSGEFSG